MTIWDVLLNLISNFNSKLLTLKHASWKFIKYAEQHHFLSNIIWLTSSAKHERVGCVGWFQVVFYLTGSILYCLWCVCRDWCLRQVSHNRRGSGQEYACSKTAINYRLSAEVPFWGQQMTDWEKGLESAHINQ